jgi:hypothetical protein
MHAGNAMWKANELIVIASCLWSCATYAQTAKWQEDMVAARRAAASGEATITILRDGHDLGNEWPAGVYVFHNNPRPYCYAYKIPGDWYRDRNWFRSKDGRSTANVTFRPPRQVERMAGETLLERSRNAAVAQFERDFRQRLTGIELKPWESSRSGAWLLKAEPILTQDGRRMPFPLYVLVDLSPHAVAEVNAFGTADDERMARQIVETIKASSDPECYLAEMERMYKAWHGER